MSLQLYFPFQDDLIQQTATPPMYLKCDLHSMDLKQLDHKFDVILVEPPLEEYQRTMGVTNMEFWSWERVRTAKSEMVSLFSSNKVLNNNHNFFFTDHAVGYWRTGCSSKLPLPMVWLIRRLRHGPFLFTQVGFSPM